MPNIEQDLQAIMDARYGRDVRQSIHDAIRDINNVADNAESVAISSQSSAQNNATKAESFAVGGTSSRTGEDTDNAKYYKEEAERLAGVYAVEDNLNSTSTIHSLSANQGRILNEKIGAPNGVASLDADGRVPIAQLPSYVDDVIEGYLYQGSFYEDSAHQHVITPESNKIYIDLTSENTYRWSGSAYAEISKSLALGETANTAYAGNKGKKNADDIADLTYRDDFVAHDIIEDQTDIEAIVEDIGVDAASLISVDDEFSKTFHGAVKDENDIEDDILYRAFVDFMADQGVIDITLAYNGRWYKGTYTIEQQTALVEEMGGGGHVVKNQTGTDLTQRPALQFLDAQVTDDSTNEITKVEVVKDVTRLQLNSMPDGLYYTPEEDIMDASDISYSSSQNLKQKIDEIAGLNRLRVLYSQNGWAQQHVINIPTGSYHIVLIAPQGTIWTGETWNNGGGSVLPVAQYSGLISSALMEDYVLTVNMASQEGLTVVMFEHTEQT